MKTITKFTLTFETPEGVNPPNMTLAQEIMGFSWCGKEVVIELISEEVIGGPKEVEEKEG